MAMSERERHELYVFIEGLFGRHTEAFMSTLAPDMPRKLDQLRSELRGEMAGVRGEMAGVRGEMAEVRGEMAQLRGDMAEVRGEVRGELKLLRGDMAGLLPKLVVANLLAMVAVAGLVLAAVSIA